MGVLDPLKVVVTNYPQGQTEWMEAVNHPQDERAGVRQIPFSRELYVERDDFMEDPPRKFFRLGPGAKFGCVLAISSPVMRSSRTPRGE